MIRGQQMMMRVPCLVIMELWAEIQPKTYRKSRRCHDLLRERITNTTIVRIDMFLLLVRLCIMLLRFQVRTLSYGLNGPGIFFVLAAFAIALQYNPGTRDKEVRFLALS